LISHIQTQADGVRGYGAEEYIWVQEGVNNRRLERNAMK